MNESLRILFPLPKMSFKNVPISRSQSQFIRGAINYVTKKVLRQANNDVEDVIVSDTNRTDEEV